MSHDVHVHCVHNRSRGVISSMQQSPTWPSRHEVLYLRELAARTGQSLSEYETKNFVHSLPTKGGFWYFTKVPILVGFSVWYTNRCYQRNAVGMGLALNLVWVLAYQSIPRKGRVNFHTDSNCLSVGRPTSWWDCWHDNSLDCVGRPTHKGILVEQLPVVCWHVNACYLVCQVHGSTLPKAGMMMHWQLPDVMRHCSEILRRALDDQEQSC